MIRLIQVSLILLLVINNTSYADGVDSDNNEFFSEPSRLSQTQLSDRISAGIHLDKVVRQWLEYKPHNFLMRSSG